MNENEFYDLVYPVAREIYLDLDRDDPLRDLMGFAVLPPVPGTPEWDYEQRLEARRAANRTQGE